MCGRDECAPGSCERAGRECAGRVVGGNEANGSVEIFAENPTARFRRWQDRGIEVDGFAQVRGPVVSCEVEEARRACVRAFSGDDAGELVCDQFGQHHQVSSSCELFAVVSRDWKMVLIGISWMPVRR